MLRLAATRTHAGARRRQLRLLRCLLSLDHQAPGTACTGDLLEQSAETGCAAGGDRRNHPGQWQIHWSKRAPIFWPSSPLSLPPGTSQAAARRFADLYPHIEKPHDEQPRTFPSRAAIDARRGQFARPRLQVGRRRAVLHRAGGWRLSVGRRRQAIHRLCGFLGTDDRRPQPSGRSRSGRARSKERAVVRHALRGRSDHGRDHDATGPFDGHGADGQLRHRSDDVGHPTGARRHGAHHASRNSKAATTATATAFWSRRAPAH